MQKSLREGKVLIDWSQNDDHKTTVSVYSLRAKSQPTVSTPLKWDEVTRALKGAPGSDLIFTSDDVLKRVDKLGDLFEPLLKVKQRLPPLKSLA
jgi:bifunctional non-homologous end joining protein LigD